MAGRNETESIRVDITGTVFLAAGPPVPKVGNRQTGEVKTDRDGRTLYEVPVLKRDPDASRAGLITIAVAGEPDGVDMGVPLKVSGLIAYAWEIRENGTFRSGVSYRAESLTAAPIQAVA
jgi:hypothetical protein